MPGHASFGNRRQELPVGDYLAQITNVKIGDADDFRDPSKKRPVFIWSVDIAVDGDWESRSLYTPRTFTDMSTNPQPQYVSNLNKLVRACGKPVPQTAEAVDAWDENDLIGTQFVWRVAEDPETGAKVRKFLPAAQSAAGSGASPRTNRPAPAAVAAADDPFENA